LYDFDLAEARYAVLVNLMLINLCADYAESAEATAVADTRCLAVGNAPHGAARGY